MSATVHVGDCRSERELVCDRIIARLSAASAPIWLEATERGRGAADALKAFIAIVNDVRGKP